MPYDAQKLFQLGKQLGKTKNLKTLKKKLGQLDKKRMTVKQKQEVALDAWYHAADNSPHQALIGVKRAELDLEANPQDVYEAATLAKSLVQAAQCMRKPQREIAAIDKHMPGKLTLDQQSAFMNMAYQMADRGSPAEAVLATKYFGMRLKMDAFDIEAARQLQEWQARADKRRLSAIL